MTRDERLAHCLRPVCQLHPTPPKSCWGFVTTCLQLAVFCSKSRAGWLSPEGVGLYESKILASSVGRGETKCFGASSGSTHKVWFQAVYFWSRILQLLNGGVRLTDIKGFRIKKNLDPVTFVLAVCTLVWEASSLGRLGRHKSSDELFTSWAGLWNTVLPTF